MGLAAPVIGHRPVAEITAPEVLAMLKKVEVRGHLETAKRLGAVVGEVVFCAIVTARASNDPTASLRGAIQAPRVKDRPAITEPRALGALLRAIEEYDGQPETRAVLRLLTVPFTASERATPVASG